MLEPSDMEDSEHLSPHDVSSLASVLVSSDTMVDIVDILNWFNELIDCGSCRDDVRLMRDLLTSNPHLGLEETVQAVLDLRVRKVPPII